MSYDIACPRAVLEKAMNQLKNAIHKAKVNTVRDYV